MPDEDFIGGMKRVRQRAQPLTVSCFKCLSVSVNQCRVLADRLIYKINEGILCRFLNICISVIRYGLQLYNKGLMLRLSSTEQDEVIIDSQLFCALVVHQLLYLNKCV